jgi:hypothetical protein
MLLLQRACARIRKVYRTSACFLYTTHIKHPRTHYHTNIIDRLQWYTSYFVAVISGALLISVSLFSAHFFISVAAMHWRDDIHNALTFNDSSDVFTVAAILGALLHFSGHALVHFFISVAAMALLFISAAAMHWRGDIHNDSSDVLT